MNVRNDIDNINNKLIEHDNNFNEIFDKLNKKEINKEYIFFKGQIYDSYEVIIDIIKTAEKSITIIDNYLDNSIIKILTNKKSNVEVLLITNKNNMLLDIDKYNKQYKGISIKINNSFHDRFIIIDDIILYHLGASIKDLGNRCFAINTIEDKKYLKNIKDVLK